MAQQPDSVRSPPTDLLGIDTGGTFTDFVLWKDGRVRVHKCLSTPAAPERAILEGIAALGVDPTALRIVHGSTVATNAVLEGKGVRTCLITNRGFADLLTIGRQQRGDIYDLQPPLPPVPVAPALCLETGGRLGADGTLVEPLTDADLDALVADIRRLAPDAVAVNLLFSYLDPTAERRIAAALPDGLFVSLSSDVLPEIREYERGMATWLNAWVGPPVAGYLSRLAARLDAGSLSIMQSSGETIAAAQAARSAVRLLLSGPAGGLVGARFLGGLADRSRLLTFDMGGTSTDVALIEGEPGLTTEGRIGAYPVAVPMVDMQTIGAGGGSIAWIDDGGMLQVGPQSAGADPGPACYGRGGEQATVSDANLMLGRLLPDAFLGGGMSLDRDAACRAVGRIASALGCDPTAAARGIVDVANEHMASALRAISVQRGLDPADFCLVSFGGAGGLHVCALADALHMSAALVPVHGGVLSALGMLAARPGRRLSRTWLTPFADVDVTTLDKVFAELGQRGAAELAAEGHAAAELSTLCSLDLRYTGQSYTLNLPWEGKTATAEGFHRKHRHRYGHRLAHPLELVNVRVAVRGRPATLALPRRGGGGASPDDVDGSGVRHCARSGLAPGTVLRGPAVITEPVATTWLAAGWSARVDDYGNLLLSRAA